MGVALAGIDGTWSGNKLFERIGAFGDIVHGDRIGLASDGGLSGSAVGGFRGPMA